MKRNKAIDLIKVFAVVVMVLGHCIQHGSGAAYNQAESYYTDSVFIYIYSFHMPLFAFVSGYLFWGSIKKRDITEMVKNRFTRLCIPLLSWQLIIGIVGVVCKGYHWGEVFLGYMHIFHNMWFLWAILACSGVIIIIHYYFKDNIFLYGSVVVCSLFLKPMFMQMWMWMFPFFLSAYFYAQKASKVTNKHHLFIWGGVSLIVHLFLVIYWDRDYYIYTTGISILHEESSILHQLFINCYRIAAAYSGCVFWIILAKCICDYLPLKIWNTVTQISEYSIGIYLLDTIIVNKILDMMTFLPANIIINLLETMVIIAVLIPILMLINRFKITRSLFLGK